MCIAIVKNIGIPLPSDETLAHCFKTNSDGAGFAYSTGGRWNVTKGLMTYEAFDKALKAVIANHPKEWVKETPMALHFRIGTHGSSNDPKHTHPFPISSKLSDLEALSYSCKHLVMHNGILQGYGTTKWDYSKPDTDKWSDTMDYIAKIVAPVQRLLGRTTVRDSVDAQSLIGMDLGTCRFIIMEPDGRSIYWGDWQSDEQGIMYSNGGYKIPEPVAKAPPTSAGVYTGRGYYRGQYDESYWDKYLPDYEAPVHEAKTVTIVGKAKPTVQEALYPDIFDQVLFDAPTLSAKLGPIAEKEFVTRRAAIHNIHPAREGNEFVVDGLMYKVTKNTDNLLFADYLKKRLYTYDGDGMFLCIGIYSEVRFPERAVS